MDGLERQVVEHETLLRGPDGLAVRVGDLEAWKSEYLQRERVETCHGCAALGEYKAAMAARGKEDAEMMKGKMSLRGVYFMGIVQFLGIAATLIIGLLKK